MMVWFCCNIIIFIVIIVFADSKRPNFVLLFPDEWRFDWADQYFINNLSIHTPTFNSIVKNGTRFVNTAVASPLCAPSRACIAAGKEYDATGVWSNNIDFPVNETTFYKLLQNNGYWVMVGGKDDLTKHSGCGVNGTYRLNELGFDDQRRCKGKNDNTYFYPNCTDPFATYLNSNYHLNNDGINVTEWNITYECERDGGCCIDYHSCPYPINVSDSAYEDNWITDSTLNMLDNMHSNNSNNNKPWYLQINWAGPHPQFFITESMNKSVNNRTYQYPMNATENPENMLITRREYTAEVENLDRAFNEIINKIREIGEYENTIFCVSSDHGEMLGDFDTWNKSKPWVASSNVPFVCMGPGIIKNNIIDTYVTNMDIAGTVLDYTNTEPLKDMTTISLRPFLNGTWNDNSNNYRNYILSGLEEWRMSVAQINETVTWKYVCCQGPCPGRPYQNIEKDGLVQLLFNIKQDLYEQNNIASLYPNVVNQMKELLPDGFCVPQ